MLVGMPKLPIAVDKSVVLLGHIDMVKSLILVGVVGYETDCSEICSCMWLDAYEISFCPGFFKRLSTSDRNGSAK